MGRDSVFKCTICGKFISYKEIDDNEIERDFTPDSEFTTECHAMTHKKCMAKDLGWVGRLKPMNARSS